MTRRLSFVLALPVMAVLGQVLPGLLTPALAQAPAPTAAAPLTECDVPDRHTEIDFPLPQVTRAIAAKRLTVLVLGAGSSQLPGAAGAKAAYPARLQVALAAKLPGVEVQVATDVKSTRTAAEMVKTLRPSLAAAKPALMIWQTATVDAMQGVDADQFGQVLAKGVKIAREAGSDVVFVNPQYSPRTESMIALSTYVEILRWVALQHEVPLFDRFNLMKAWADLGTFDLYSATKKLDMAQRVHACLGRLLADLVLESSKAHSSNSESGQEPGK
ncbi:MAG: SGNH/GDSL hydrolase family protein [Pseudolabrys sp.]|nr:SGNH/GDSL hydrolase family protein [Pseudolabrys sp.]MDP2294839.1 SGNH/GDSL hydrolase family protein [Pseudolabrys sp.]